MLVGDITLREVQHWELAELPALMQDVGIRILDDSLRWRIDSSRPFQVKSLIHSFLGKLFGVPMLRLRWLSSSGL